MQRYMAHTIFISLSFGLNKLHELGHWLGLGHYNKKMCFGSDAAHWTNLGNNVNHFSLGSHAGSPVSIIENWFVTHITASYVSNGYRIIAYADGLNASTGYINIYHNVIVS